MSTADRRMPSNIDVGGCGNTLLRASLAESSVSGRGMIGTPTMAGSTNVLSSAQSTSSSAPAASAIPQCARRTPQPPLPTPTTTSDAVAFTSTMPPLASPEQSFVPTAADCSELFDEFNVDEVPAGDDDAIDAYALLNVSEDTPTSAVRSRFHRLSLLMHPDRAGGKLSFPVVSDAHAMLKDAKSRNAYDALGASGVRSLHDDDVHAVRPPSFSPIVVVIV